MDSQFTLLSENELDRLDRFLLERINDDVDTEGKDEGVLDISELDGLFTAIVSGPVPIQPSQWLPAVWGDFEPVWEGEKDFEQILSLMVRHMNGIVTVLMEQLQNFEPLFLENKLKDKTYTVVDEWCQGYMRGVALTMDQWDEGGKEITIMLIPIITFASESGWEALDKMSDTEVENLQKAITPNVREIHAFWLARRENDIGSVLDLSVPRASPRVGRNDPCPCGSGRKYKKCCLH